MITDFMVVAKPALKKYAQNIFTLSNRKGYYAMRGLSFHKLSASKIKQIKKKGNRSHYA
mgnify:CR=1 FL=1